MVLNSFIEINYWDEARVYISEKKIGKGVTAPVLKQSPIRKEKSGNDELHFYKNT